MQDKIAIHVPNKWLSEAVQKYLFGKGYEWKKGYKPEREGIEYLDRSYLILIQSKKRVDATDASKGYLQSDGYTILTVDEFFKREGERDKVRVNSAIVSATPKGFSFITNNQQIVVITWKEYDEIGKLRPREGE